MSLDNRRTWGDSWPIAAFGLVLRICLALALLYVLYRVGLILVVVLVSTMLALAMAPMVDWLRKSALFRPLKPHARRTWATTVAFLVVAASLVGLGFVIVRPMAAQVMDFAKNWEAHKRTLNSQITQVQKAYNDLPPDIRAFVEEQGGKDFGPRGGEQLQQLAHRTAESGMLLVEMILIPVLAFSFLTESKPLKREFISLLPRARVRDGLFLLGRTAEILKSYALGQLILALIAGGVTYALMLAIGVPYALPLSLLAAVTRVIPVFGPVLGGVPIVLVSALGPKGINGAIVVLIAFTLMHLIETKVVMPRIIGHRIQLHPAVVIIVLLIGAQFFGMWGMFLAAPVAAVIKVLLQHYLVRPRNPGAFRRSRLRSDHGLPPGPRTPTSTQLPVGSEEERNIELAAIAGAGHHSGAH